MNCDCGPRYAINEADQNNPFPLIVPGFASILDGYLNFCLFDIFSVVVYTYNGMLNV